MLHGTDFDGTQKRRWLVLKTLDMTRVRSLQVLVTISRQLLFLGLADEILDVTEEPYGRPADPKEYTCTAENRDAVFAM